jgi:hypothetical protein
MRIPFAAAKKVNFCGATISAVVAIAPMAHAPVAHADPILMGGVLSPALTFTPQANNTVKITTSGYSSNAIYGPDLGVVLFGPMDTTTGSAIGNIFPMNATESFTYQANLDSDNPNIIGQNSSDHLTMAINWTQLYNGGEVELIGTGHILTSFGDTPFVTDFPIGGITTVHGYFPVNLTSPIRALRGT